jgi:hypothetical protein
MTANGRHWCAGYEDRRESEAVETVAEDRLTPLRDICPKSGMSAGTVPLTRLHSQPMSGFASGGLRRSVDRSEVGRFRCAFGLLARLSADGGFVPEMADNYLFPRTPPTGQPAWDCSGFRSVPEDCAHSQPICDSSGRC